MLTVRGLTVWPLDLSKSLLCTETVVSASILQERVSQTTKKSITAVMLILRLILRIWRQISQAIYTNIRLLTYIVFLFKVLLNSHCTFYWHSTLYSL